MATFTKPTDNLEAQSLEFKKLMAWMSYWASKDTGFGKSTALKSTPVDDSTRRFINLEQSFLQQFEKRQDHFPGLTEYFAKEKMKQSAEPLLFCAPDTISLQLTQDGSIYYTVRKNDIAIYLDHFLIDEFDGRDEAIVSIFKKDEKLLDFGGTLEETMLQLSEVLAPESIAIPSFA